MTDRFITPVFTAVDGTGNTVSGAKLFFYDSGTTTAKNTFSDTSLTTVNPNPLIADFNGRFDDIFLGAGDYSVVLKDADDGKIWARDPVSGMSSSEAADEWVDSGNVPTRTSDAIFTIAGDVTATYHAGRRLKLTDSSTLYGTITASSFSSPDTTITVALDSGALSASLSAVAVGILSKVNPSVPPSIDYLNRRNLIINGAMRVNQRGTQIGVGTIGSNYTLDRWRIENNSGEEARLTVSQDTDVPSGEEFGYCIKVDVTTAETAVGAAELMHLNQRIEAQNLQHLRYGDASAKTLTLQFWIKSPKSGTHCVALNQEDAARSYPQEFTVDSVNTWEFKVVTFPGDPSGTINNDNGSGLVVSFPLIAGTNFQGTADLWQAGNKIITANQQNLLDNTANNIYVTGVQLELGAVATPFEHLGIDQDLARCQRYYWEESLGATGRPFVNGAYALSTTVAIGTMFFPVEMRSAPALGTTGTASDYRIYNQGSGTTCSVVPTNDHTTTKLISMDWRVASGLTADTPCKLEDGSGSGKVTLNAEL